MVCSVFALAAQAQQNDGPGFMDKVKQSLDPAAISGLYSYDADEVLKALKIGKASRKNAVSEVLDGYNGQVEALRTDNLMHVADLGMSLREIFTNKAYGDILSSRADYKREISALRTERKAAHAEMEDALEEVLTRRQERKWNKYENKRRAAVEAQFGLGDVMEYIGF